jgi:hypothetical protein
MHLDNQSNKRFNIDRISNSKNANMNNLMSIDFAMRDWVDDTDQMIPRSCLEFPRLSDGYNDFKAKEKRPWGDKSTPVYCDPFLDENLMRLNGEKSYEKGVWYYTGFPLTDHHDFAGIPKLSRVIQTLFGREYRPQFYINIYNRLRNLDFSDQDPTPISLMQREYLKENHHPHKGLEPKNLNTDIAPSVSEHESENMSLGDFLESEMQIQVCNFRLNDLQRSKTLSIMDINLKDLNQT